MGIRQAELVPIGVLGPTPITPAGKPTYVKAFQATRSNTTTTLKAGLPAQSSIMGVMLYGSVASDALTTATLTITVSNNIGVISTGVVDVKANGAATALVNMSALPNIEPNPLLGDLRVSAIYAETGTASTVGGPWNLRVLYV